MRNVLAARAARGLIVALIAVGSVALLSPSSATGQSSTLSWTETSTLEVPGNLGLLLRTMPGALDTRSSQHMLHLQGGSLIQRDGQHTTLIDADDRRFVTIDDDARTYMVMTFDESAQAARDMSAMMSEAMADAEVSLDESAEDREATMAELRQAMEEAREALDFRLNTERTGRTQSFGAAGTAAQHIIMAELHMAAPPEGVEDAESGTLVFVMELWQSDDLPTPGALYEQWAAELASDPALRSMASDLSASAEGVTDASEAALAMWDPRMSAGLNQLAEAVEHLDGTTVRSVVTVALVPDGLELDRDELLAWEPESTGDRIRREASGAAKEAVAGAARKAFGGLFGRGGDEPEEAEEELVLRPLFRLTTTKEDIVHGDTGEDVLSTLQQRMDGYRQVTFEELTAGAEVR